MKKNQFYLLAILILVSTFSLSKAQINIDPETKKIMYQETVAIDSVSKDQLYERAIDWMTNYFKTNKFDVNDKTNYKLAHTGDFPVSYTYDFKYKSENTILFDFTLNIKDGKYRYTITDFKIYDNKLGVRTAQPLEISLQKMKTDAKKEFTNKFSIEVNKLINELKTNLATKKKEDKEEEWD